MVVLNEIWEREGEKYSNDPDMDYHYTVAVDEGWYGKACVYAAFVQEYRKLQAAKELQLLMRFGLVPSRDSSSTS